MKTKIFQIIIFDYGIGFEYSRYKGEANPKKENYNSDGSIKKYKIYKSFHKYSNPYIAFRFMWNYSILFRLYLNRD